MHLLRSLSRSTFAGLLLVSACVGRSLAGSLADSRPNILLIFADDLGYSDIGCFGADIIETPNIDRLGADGLRMTQFYNNAKCAPSRASLLTGLYAQQAGCMGEQSYLTHCVTLGEALAPAGYHTWMTGKWHEFETPYQRGFEHFFGLCAGEANYWNPGPPRPGESEPGNFKTGHYPRWAIDGKIYENGWTPPNTDFYATDAFTDHAIAYLRESAGDGKPFLLHVAYTAPHFPLQAYPEDIAKYRGKFMCGWDELRERRHRRQIALGIVDPHWSLSDRDEGAPAWSSLSDAQKRDWDLRMSVYAAMIDRLDRNIGRLLRALEETGQLKNTLVLFMSDNGGCAQSFNQTPDIDPGPVESFRTVDLPWANASNTPFRKYKRWDHEGGISTPFIASWPGVIAPGQIRNDVGHIIDIMPTLLELAGARYPGEHDGKSVVPCEGISLLPILEGGEREPHRVIGWQYGLYAALRRGDWKVVRASPQSPWELYDLKADRTETRDLASSQPKLRDELVEEYRKWAKKVGAPAP